MTTKLETCPQCNDETTHLYKPCGDSNAPEMCTNCVYDWEEDLRVQEELDYLQAEDW